MRWLKFGRKQNKKALTVSDTPILADVWPTFGRDMCDNCPQLAKVRVFIPHNALVLDFCSHHFRKHEKVFTEKGYLWIDGRRNHDKFKETVKDIHAKPWVGTLG